LLVLLHSLLIDWLMIEPRNGWLDVVSLSHVEVLSEVLISAPPIEMNHGHSLVPLDLMEIGVSDIVFMSISWESSITVWTTVIFIVFTIVPSPLIHHTLLLLLSDQV
jgi:hypothetical protein